MTSVVRRGIIALLLLSAAGCGRDSLGLSSQDVTRDLRIQPAGLSLFIGQQFSIDVLRRQSDGSEISVLGDPELVLRAGAPEIVSIADDGQGEALAAGTTTVGATLGTLSAEASVNVVDARLVGLRVEPPLLQLETGEVENLTVFGVLDDGSEVDLSSPSSGTAYTLLDGTGIIELDENGRVEARASGSAVIEISNLTFAVALNVEVTGTIQPFIDLRVEPERLTLGFGESAPLRVIAVRADGDSEEVTDQAVYGDAEPLAFITPEGIVTAGMTPGGLLVEVTFQDLVAVFEINVTPGMSELVGIEVVPPEIFLGVGQQERLTVIGLFSDGSSADITSAPDTTFRSDDPGIVEVSPLGVVLGIAPNPFPIFVSVENGGFQATTAVVVTEEIRPVALNVEPNPIDLSVGEEIQLIVLATFSDGAILEVSNDLALSLNAVPPNLVEINFPAVVGAREVGRGELFVEYFGVVSVVPIEVTQPDPVVALRIEPSAVTLDTGESQVLQFIAIRQSGAEFDVTDDPNLLVTVGNSAVAQYLGNGQLVAGQAGLTAVVANFAGQTAQARVEVNDTTVRLTGIEVSVATQVGVGATTPITVLASFSDGSVQDVGNDPNVLIESSNPMILEVTGTTGRGVSVGAVTVTATFQGFTDSAPVQVILINDPFINLAFAPAGGLTLSVGASQTVNVIGIRTSGATEVVTTDPSLSLTATSTAIMFTVGGPGIVVTGANPGTATLRATLDGLEATLPVAVSGSVTLSSIALTGPARLSVGGVGILQVVATFSDGSTLDVTSDPNTSISSLNTNAVTVMGSQARGVAVGSAVIRASFQGRTATLTIEVLSNPNAVQSLQFIPPNLILTAGGVPDTVTLQAIFFSGVVADATFAPGVTYVNSGPITVTNDPNGLLVRGNAVGTASIEATFQGVSTTLNITILPSNVRLDRITLTAPSSLQVGTTATYTVNAIFTDGTTVDVTQDPSTFVNIQPTGFFTAANGALTAVAAGTATLRVSFGGRSAQQNITVAAAMDPIVAISFLPPSLSVQVGQQRNVQVFGLRQSGQTIELTNDPALVLTTTGPVQLGMTPITVIGTSPGGLGQVNASFQGLTASLAVSVGNAPTLDDITVVPNPVTLSVGQNQQLAVTGEFSDGTTQPITSATFLSLDPGVATVSSTGLATGVSGGTTTIGVTFSGILSIVPVTVSSLGPTITALSPPAVATGSGTTQVLIDGTNFTTGSEVLVNGAVRAAGFVSASRLQLRLPASFFAMPGQITVQVRNGTQTSNTESIEVGDPPVVTQVLPSAVVVGASVTVDVTGTGLNNLTFSGSDLTITVVSTTPNGTSVRIRVTAAAGATPGPRSVTVQNAFGSDSFPIDVFPSNDLVVNSGQTVRLSGTNQFRRVVVNTGGTVLGTGNGPVTIIAAESIAIRGNIDVSGGNGVDGLSNAGDGGDGGPGGAGGGGAGNGTGPATIGGVGTPNGSDGLSGGGAGTPGGAGGGNGGGGPGASGCGRAGGGGGLGGNGGRGGGDATGLGGAGGIASSGSTFGAGTGGGGGSTCGPNGGGGGGGGGGRLTLQLNGSGTILIDGQVTADGGDGGQGFSGTGGGGGGSGGRIEVRTNGGTIVVNDTISARGGVGGNSDFGAAGGGGGGGIVVLDARPGGTINTALGQVLVTGGAGGTSRGGGANGLAGAIGGFTSLP